MSHLDAKSELANDAKYLDSILQGQDWFVGNQLSGADIMLSFPLQLMKATAPELVTAALDAFIARVEARPAYERAEKRGGKLDFKSVGI